MSNQEKRMLEKKKNLAVRHHLTTKKMKYYNLYALMQH
jgi:hypothetical protein